MKKITSSLFIGCAVSLLVLPSVHAQVTATWDYSWDRVSDGFPGGSDNGGHWNSLDMSMSTAVIDNGPIGGSSPLNDYTWVKDTAFSINVNIGNWDWGDADALFLVITNSAAAPDTANADWTALYLDGSGNYYAAVYANSPTSTHNVLPLMTGTYSKTTTGSGTGTDTIFSLSFSESELATLATGPGGASWEGFGYPFDNDGDTTGNSDTPYRMGLWGRSYLDGALSVSSGSKGVSWTVIDTGRIGTIDLVHDFEKGPTTIPEPSSALLVTAAGLGLMLRRRR
ncbi:MAG: PEP-CTERM sorting domain-containing protein [Akkermansiaceae bacterium]|nr:PEP-CTERM sorting domain-containing protein [Akkermansiaceae bacterium]